MKKNKKKKNLNWLKYKLSNKKLILIITLVVSAIIVFSLYSFAGTWGTPPNDFMSKSGAKNCRNMSPGYARVDCWAEYFESAGIRENPANTNKGTWVSWWLKQTGVDPGEPWCAAFVSHMLWLGYGRNDIPKSASTATMVSQFRTMNNKAFRVWDYTGKTGNSGIGFWVVPGSIVYRTRPTGGHVGVVVSTNRDTGKFITVEGNTRCSDGKNDCLRRRAYDGKGSPLDSDNISAGIGPWVYILAMRY